EWGVGNGEWGMGNGEWGVGSRVKTFRCLTFTISLCPNVLGGCYNSYKSRDWEDIELMPIFNVNLIN
ncbi:hypothetical protein PN509_14060, partial [Nodularia spumigena CS-588/02]|nr:hypothetical protein [Nodularia spumigena CS-588/02]MDB9365805.1 hypothetical protein [Nodularia spumigena CS-588/02A10]